MLGSSPLTRGKPGDRARDARPEGLIPAHAGKTSSRSPRRSGRRAHPRSRGENCHAGGTQAARGGSSPLTRGKLSVTAELTVMVGLIPAHAGKTHAHRFNVFCIRAHPRSRGENLAVPYGVEIELGSSPLTRGKPDRRRRRPRRPGLIPAHAGKTSGCARSPGGSAAHPRSRGENTF